MRIAASAVETVQSAVRDHPRVLAVGGRSKPALSTPSEADVVELDVRGLRGIVEYDPRELTVTALAGTPIRELSEALAAHDQHLPFDPPLRGAGATLGGVVAAGASGPGAFRRGGLRDFVIGARFVDGRARLVSGGGKVVKNAAGFDLPKLLVGSTGRLGVIIQLSLKVFPRPSATMTAVFELGGLGEAIAALVRLARGPLPVEALELEPPGRVLVRIGSADAALVARVADSVGRAPVDQMEDDARFWERAAELAWAPAGASLVRVAITPGRVAAIDARVVGAGAQVRYSLGANVAWIAWPADVPLDRLDADLRLLGCPGMVLTGARGRVMLGAVRDGAFGQRIRAALDPDRRFPPA